MHKGMNTEIEVSRISLATVAYVIQRPWRGRYAAVTRPAHDTIRSRPSYTYSIKQLALRSPLAQQIKQGAA